MPSIITLNEVNKYVRKKTYRKKKLFIIQFAHTSHNLAERPGIQSSRLQFIRQSIRLSGSAGKLKQRKPREE